MKKEHVAPPFLNRKLSPTATDFVPKSSTSKKNKLENLASVDSPTNANAIILGDDCFDEDEEDIMLDICFDKVARDGTSHLGIKEVKVAKTKRRHMKGNIVGMVM